MDRVCPGCRMQSWNEVGPSGFGFRLWRCLGCGCLRIDRDRPVVDELYEHYYEGPEAHRLFGPFDRLLRAFRSRKARLILKWTSPPGNALDIGCERGDLLHALERAGLHVRGTQISQVAAEHARSRYGIDVFVGELRDAPFANDRFDVVTMLNVLEHLEDPEGYLAVVARMTRAGGIFWVEVPNVHSFTARLTGKRWLHHDPEHHLWGFHVKALEVMLGRHGFSIERTYHDCWEYAPIGCLQSWLNFLPGPPNRLFDLVRKGPGDPLTFASQLVQVALAALLLLPACVVSALEMASGSGQVILVRARRGNP